MILNYRRYHGYDYPTLCEWLKEMEWPLMPQRQIPNYGIVVHDIDGNNLGIAFIYMIEKEYDFIFPALLMPNPNARFKQLTKIMDAFATAFEDIAREHGKSHIILTMSTSSMSNYFSRKHDYNCAEQNVVRMVKCLDESKKTDLLFWYDDDGLQQYFPDLYAEYLRTKTLPEVQ